MTKQSINVFVASALLACSLSFAEAEDGGQRVSSLLQIHIPHNMTKPGGYEHKEALFGIPPYGGSIHQNVYYADSDLCDADVDTRRGFPVREKEDNSDKMKPWPTPYILMVDRGACTFVAKVRNAQRVGASGVVVADNTCVCGEPNCVPDPNVGCESREPIMADDGSGSDISIPSFLMKKTDAEIVKKRLKENKPVQMEMAWSLPSPDDHVEYELWTLPSERLGRKFLDDFKSAAVALGSHASFAPNMYVYDGKASGCTSDGENMCYTLCTNGGWYCAPDPDHDLDKGISGADVVKESLRRMCIWDRYGKEDGIGAEWWDYVKEFSHRCEYDPDFFNNDDCIRDAMAHSAVDFDSVEECMVNSGGLDDPHSNSILDKLIERSSDLGVVVLPSAFVNNVPLRGSLTFPVVFEAICAGFLEGTEPEICTECAECPHIKKCVEDGFCYAAAPPVALPDSVSYRTLKVSLLAVTAVMIGLGVLYRRKHRQEMREEVRNILTSYMLLDEDDEGAGRIVGGGRA